MTRFIKKEKNINKDVPPEVYKMMDDFLEKVRSGEIELFKEKTEKAREDLKKLSREDLKKAGLIK